MQHAYDARNFEVLNISIQTLSKKHGQLKSVIQAMVEQAIAWLPEVKERDGTDKWLELLETLRTVTEGKVRPFFCYDAAVSILIRHLTPDLPRNPSRPRHPPPLPLL